MVATIYAGFNTDRIGSLGGAFDTAAISLTTISLAAGRYSHVNLSSVMGTGLYVSPRDALVAAINVADPTTDFDISFSTTTRRYTTSNAGNVFTLDFTSTAGQRLAKMLGFTSANADAISGSGYACVIQPADGIAESDVLPYYLVPLARDEPSSYSRPYEPDGAVKREVTVNANALSVEPLSQPQLLDFNTLFLPLANVFIDDAAAAQPWTIQHLCRHAGAREPVLFDFVSTGDLVCKLGKRNAAFTRESRELAFQQADYHGLFHYKWVEAQYLGRL